MTVTKKQAIALFKAYCQHLGIEINWAKTGKQLGTKPSQVVFDEISLSAMDSQQLAEALDAPAEPNEALTKLFKGENK